MAVPGVPALVGECRAVEHEIDETSLSQLQQSLLLGFHVARGGAAELIQHFTIPVPPVGIERVCVGITPYGQRHVERYPETVLIPHKLDELIGFQQPVRGPYRGPEAGVPAWVEVQ
jgi:hypothetical protein